MTRAALLQLTSSDDPAENLGVVVAKVRQAATDGAEWVLTPEVTNCVSASRAHQLDVLKLPDSDEMLAALQAEASRLGTWILIGSLAVKTDDPDGRFANRSFLISDQGRLVETYDKIHMFDVDISDTESYRESRGYRPGTRAVVADTPFGMLGMTICYDMRFPNLYQDLAQAGAQILTVPSAFSPVTGAAHWHSLLRARAIETGCFVIAPAQTGVHKAQAGKARSTYGHSLVVSPWGEVILDAGTAPGIYMFDLDIKSAQTAREKIPSLTHIRDFKAPT